MGTLTINAELLRGHLSAMILALIEHEPMHGYAVMESLGACTSGRLALSTGTVYPALRRLEKSGLLQSHWTTVDGRDRRIYQLTRAGREALAAERKDWRLFVAMVDAVLSGEAAVQVLDSTTAEVSPRQRGDDGGG